MFRLISLIGILGASFSQVDALTCPSTVGKAQSFSVTIPTAISIEKTSGVGSLCTLTLELDNGLFIPIARSYDGNNWERAGGSFIATSPEWVCSGSTCSSTIPAGNKYVLATRSISSTAPVFNAELARFMESASFGVKPTDLTSWNGKSFAQYVKDQVATPVTSHREVFRKMANPRWSFNKPEFTGHLNPCAPNSTWRRQVLTTNDRKKTIFVRRVSDRWEIKVDGHVRTMVTQLRFVNAQKSHNDVIAGGASYEICSSEVELRRNVFRVRTASGNCRPLMSDDLIVDFPPGFVPKNSIQGLIPAMAQNSQWKSISSRNPEYMFNGAIIPTNADQSLDSMATSLRATTSAKVASSDGGLFCLPLFKFLSLGLLCRKKPVSEPTVPASPTSPIGIRSPTPPVSPRLPTPPTGPKAPTTTPVAPRVPTAPVAPRLPTTPIGPKPPTTPPTVPTSPIASPNPNVVCKVTLPSSIVNAPLFAKTSDGIWLQHDPRIDMKKNTMSEPLPDGGLAMLKAKQTFYCSNAARTSFNEDKCFMSKVPACFPGSTDQSVATIGTMVCGSPGEISNDITLGDNWLDIASLDNDRSVLLGLPEDTASLESLGRQREFIWSEIALKANDQLRQRVAFALSHIFSLPKVAIRGEFQSTEMFLIYYDIFTRNAFGNYGDILKEISYNTLNAESLSYIDSRSVAHASSGTNTIVFPDENYARELMQLFTIGLFALNMDGTPALNVNGTVQTYDSDDILSFAKVWTAFRTNFKRANIEAPDGGNKHDPLRVDAERRDRFPKTDLSNGYIGDYYPLCTDLPAKAYLSIGAKYRLLGSSPLPELKKQAWTVTQDTETLKLQSQSSLYNKLCKQSQTGVCTYPSIVVLDSNLACNDSECSIDTLQVIQVDSVFYEYIRTPCVEQPFFTNGVKISGRSRDSTSVCTDPSLPVASEACCSQNVFESRKKDAIPACLMTGELMSRNTAQLRCESIGMGLCDYRNVIVTKKCPNFGFYWTSDGCVMRVKVSSDGQAAIVHQFPNTNSTDDLKSNSQNYFKVYWKNNQFPSVASSCGGGQCVVFEDTCICNVTVANDPVFVSTPPVNSVAILAKLRIGHPGLSVLKANAASSNSDYKYYGKTQTPLDQSTVFEVKDRNGQTKFLRNLKSTVGIVGTVFEFRNPPQFNSILSTEYSAVDANYETEAALDHLLYHPNTPPFVAYRFIQRFGVSNPSPRYTLAVANAFKTGSFSNRGITFGQGKYGDMEAMIAAVLLDREARSAVLDKDPAQGTLREPILKVLSFMRATDFKSSVPLVELDLMDAKVGQMAYEQGSVFSFFRPEYSPSELSGTGLTAPESQAMSSTNIVGLMNGLYSLIKYGLNECNGGFGAYGDCSNLSPSGNIMYVPSTINSPRDMVRDLSYLLTGGRMTETKQQAIATEIAAQPNATSKYQLALQLMASSPEFHSTSTSDPLAFEKQPKVPNNIVPPTSDYKAVIHLFFRGGCDSFNVLVPDQSCGSFHQEYKEARGVIGLKPAETLPLTGDARATQQPCSTFTVHKGLSMIQKLYNEKDLLFMANAGVLTQYVNRSDYAVRTETPLFSHNSMQDEVAKLDPLKALGGTGALGRMVDVLQEKGYMTARTIIDAPSSNLASRSAITPPIVSMSAKGASLFNVAPSSSTMYNTVQQLNNGISGVYGDLWSTLMKRSINQTNEIYNILSDQATTTVFPSTPLGSRFKIAAQMIAARQSRGVDRDVFFIPFDGFDTHNEVTETLKTRFEELNDALEDFVAELKLLGVWDNVAIVQSSDFGRTMTGNSGGGTDHGWGGNYWLAGGGVKGQRIVGKYPPTFSLDYEYNIDRGRLIPTTSWDSIFSAISEWMGVTNSLDLKRVIPNRNKFADVFTSSVLFN